MNPKKISNLNKYLFQKYKNDNLTRFEGSIFQVQKFLGLQSVQNLDYRQFQGV